MKRLSISEVTTPGWSFPCKGISRAVGRIFDVHIDDWGFPTRNFGVRVIMGDGIIPLAKILQAIERTSYKGCYEVELFSDDLSKTDRNSLLEKIKIPLGDGA